MSRRIPVVLATVAIAFAALAVAPAAGTGAAGVSGAAGREAPDGVEFGELSGRIEALRPRGSTSEDQPAWVRRIAAAVSAFVPQNGIQYHNGPVVMNMKVVSIYWAATAIYQGGPNPATTPTGPGSDDGSLVGTFLRSLGGSPYYNINTTYTNSSGTAIPNTLQYTAFWANNHNVQPECTNVSDATIQAEILYGLNYGLIPYDPSLSTIYSVFTSGKVNPGGGFGNCTAGKQFQYCAYHGYFTANAPGKAWNGKTLLYSAQPYNWSYPSSCTGFGTANAAPNGDPGADATINTLAHELEEANTDPQLNAWYDTQGSENADKCAWTWGTMNADGKGNVTIGGKSFLVQQNWLNVTPSGRCAQTYGTVAPTTGTITGKVTIAGTSTGIAAATVSAPGATTTTDGTGNYTLTNVTAGSVTVNATKTGYTANSTSATVTAGATTSGANIALTATAPTTGTVSGTVKDSVSNAVISGATVSIGSLTTTTNGSGVYTIAGVTPGTVTVTASKTNYTSQADSTVSVTAGTTTTRDFALVPTTGSITGAVTDGATSAGIVGATVSVSGGPSTTTGAGGVYTLTGVAVGSPSVTATKAGYSTSTASVPVAAGLQATKNFALTSTASSPAAPSVTAATNARSCFFGLFCSGGGVRLTWSAPAANGSAITTYRIYRSSTPTVTIGSSPYASTTSTAYTDSSTTSGTTYYYIVLAVNAIGPSPASNTASARAG